MAQNPCVPNNSIANYLFSVTLFFVLAQVCFANQPSGCVKQKFHIFQPNQVDRRFIISEHAPTAEALRARADLREKIEPMISLLRSIVGAIDFRRKNNDDKQCNLENKVNPNWVYTALLSSQFLQIGELNSRCYSQLDGADAVSSGLLSKTELHNSMRVIGDGVQALYQALRNVTQSPEAQGTDSWAESFPLRDWGIGDDFQNCKVETFSSYRMGTNFFLRASMTNHQVNIFVKDRSRQFISEWVRDDYSQSLKIVHPSVKEKELVAGTTLLEQWAGRAWTSWHGEMDDKDNPAVRKSSAQNEKEIGLAKDSLVASNIAIISLPLLMNFIPHAFVAEFITLGSLVYIFLTDIASVVPFLIKGIELVSSTRSRPVLVAYYAGDEELADIQIWAADCAGGDRLSDIGWIFIAVGVFTLIFGIVIEVMGKRYMERKRKEAGPYVAGPFGKAMFESTGKGILGTRYHDLQSDLYSEYSCEFDINSGTGDKEKTSDASLEAKQSRKESALRWVWILLRSSRLGVWVSSQTDLRKIVNEADAGVGHDGIASAERVDVEKNEI